MVKDIRYIIKKVIIGVLIGVALIMFKSYRVNAATIDTIINANSYYQSQYCTQGDTITDDNWGTGSRFSCTKGPSYKFSQYLNNDTDNVSVPALFSQGQLINNFTFEINFEDVQTITSTNRYIVLRAPWVSSNSSTSPKYLGVYDGYLTLNGVVSNQVRGYSPSVSSFFNQPQYCNYVNDNGDINICNIYIAPYSSLNRYVFYIDIPVNTNVKSITLFFGNNNIQDTYDLYTGVINNDFRAMTPTSWKYNSSCGNSTTNLDCYKTLFARYQDYSNNNYNVYGASALSGAGLIYYKYGPANSTFTPSNVSENLWFETTYDTSTNVIYNFSSSTQSIQDYYNNLVGNIENEINPSVNTDGFFTDFLDGFTTSTQASGLLSLFNNMFLYPMQKLNTNASVDLVRQNINGTYILNDFICMKNSTASYPSTYNAYEVHFYRDYKFKLPCPHTEIYNKLYYGEYGFYGNNFKGASIHTGIQYSFVDIWLTIQHGLLVYLLFVNCLNIYKYVLDSNKTEIEVLEL